MRRCSSWSTNIILLFQSTFAKQMTKELYHIRAKKSIEIFLDVIYDTDSSSNIILLNKKVLTKWL